MAALGFLLAVSLWPTFSSGSALRWIVLMAGLPLCSWMDPRKVPHLVGTLLAAGVIWAAATLSWSPDPSAGAYYLFHMIVLAGVVLAAASLQSVDRVLMAVGWGLAISSAVCILQEFGVETWVPSVANPAGLFINRDVLAEAAAPVFVWAILTWSRLLTGFLAVPLVLCGSRVAILAALIGVGSALPRRWRGATMVLVGTVVGALTLMPGKMGSLASRVDIWQFAIAHIGVFGHGLGWFSFASSHEYAHSDALQLIDELGIGAAPFFGIAIFLLWRAPRPKPLHGAFLASMVQAVISFPLHLPVSAFVAAVLAGGLARGVSRVGWFGSSGGTWVVGSVWKADPHRYIAQAH